MARIATFTAPEIVVRPLLGGQFPIEDLAGNVLGKAELRRGFAEFFTVGAQAGFECTIRGGLDGLRRELAKGIRNGRDDRQ